jgi:hypothetical protein
MQNEVSDLETPGEDDEIAEDDDVDLDEEDDTEEDTVVFSTSKGSDNVGDVSVEINVEELIAEFESSVDSEAARRKEIRRRLEEIREQKEAKKDLEDTYSFDLYDDD